MTITKSQIVDSIYHLTGVKKRQSAPIIETTIEIMKRTLASRESVMISGLGKFEVRGKNPRKGRNPQTINDLTLNARRVVTFKCSGVLREGMKSDKRRDFFSQVT